MTQSVWDSLLGAFVGGTIGTMIGMWIERWMGKLPPRRRPVGEYECPHGFATVRDCPVCSHFGKIRTAEKEEERR